MISEYLFRTLRPGDIVRIVDAWPADQAAIQNSQGKMDCWLGKVMTVDIISQNQREFIRMREDRRFWFWNRFSIDCVLSSAPDNADDLPEDPDTSVLF